MDGLEGTWIEWRTVESRDFDGRLLRIDSTPEGRVAIVERVRSRHLIREDLEHGEHETIPLKGLRRVAMRYVVESGPCSLPRE